MTIAPGTRVRITVDERNESSRGSRTITHPNDRSYIRDGQTADVLRRDYRDYLVRLDEGHHWSVDEVWLNDRFLTPLITNEGISTTSTPTQPLRDRVWDYLTSGEGDTILRMQALKDLVDRGVFAGELTPTQITDRLERYLEENPRELCAEGRARFRNALLAPAKKYTTVLLNVESDVHLTAGSVCTALRGREIDGHEITDVTWWDYNREESDPSTTGQRRSISRD